MLVRFLSVRMQQKQSRPISKIESKIKVTVCFIACHINKYRNPLLFSKFFSPYFTMANCSIIIQNQAHAGFRSFRSYDIQRLQVAGYRLQVADFSASLTLYLSDSLFLPPPVSASFIRILRPLNFLPSMALIILVAIHLFHIDLAQYFFLQITHVQHKLKEAGFIKPILGAEVDK